jgi:UDP:flavonoid glycosyltransferase YjiC (YdhE family)
MPMLEQVLWPRGRRTVTAKAGAPRLPTLAGKTIGHLWDDLFRGDEIFPLIEEALGERFPDVRFVSYRTFGSTHGANEHEVLRALPARMRELGVDAVISGMAC